MFKSLQEAYDATVTHLEKQGCRAAIPFRSKCMYLTDDGRKCAVGAHIPDGHPGQQVRGSVSMLNEQFPDLFEGPLAIEGTSKKTALHFWKLLQHAHDEDLITSEMNTKLKDIAEMFHLTPRTISNWGNRP